MSDNLFIASEIGAGYAYKRTTVQGYREKVLEVENHGGRVSAEIQVGQRIGEKKEEPKKEARLTIVDLRFDGLVGNRGYYLQPSIDLGAKVSAEIFSDFIFRVGCSGHLQYLRIKANGAEIEASSFGISVPFGFKYSFGKLSGMAEVTPIFPGTISVGLGLNYNLYSGHNGGFLDSVDISTGFAIEYGEIKSPIKVDNQTLLTGIQISF